MNRIVFLLALGALPWSGIARTAAEPEPSGARRWVVVLVSTGTAY